MTSVVESKLAQPHLAYLDGLRACLALFVVAHHCYLTVSSQLVGQVGGFAGVNQGLARWLIPLRFGGYAVLWFIVLSGYCLALPTTRNGLQLNGGAARFFMRRARRILPTFYAALLICTLLALGPLKAKSITLWDLTIPVDSAACISNALLLQDFWRQHTINYVFWSIAVEWRIYFVFPALLLLFRKITPTIATLVAVPMLLACACIAALSPATRWMTLTLYFTGLFVLGAFAAWISANRSDRKRSRIFLAAAAGFMVLTVVANRIHYPHEAFRQPTIDTAFGLFAASLLVAWGLHPRSLGRRVLECKPLPAIGLFAYSLYLMHAPVIQVVYTAMHPDLHRSPTLAVVELIVAATLASLIVAYLFFLVFERPFMSSRQKKATLVEGAVPA